MTTSFEQHSWPEEHEARIEEAGLAWDLVLQIAALRRAQGVSQAELAERLGTKQPNVSRLENPTYDRQSLQTLRAVGQALDALVDVIFVPRTRATEYMAHRYLPALGQSPPPPRERFVLAPVMVGDMNKASAGDWASWVPTTPGLRFVAQYDAVSKTP